MCLSSACRSYPASIWNSFCPCFNVCMIYPSCGFYYVLKKATSFSFEAVPTSNNNKFLLSLSLLTGKLGLVLFMSHSYELLKNIDEKRTVSFRRRRRCLQIIFHIHILRMLIYTHFASLLSRIADYQLLIIFSLIFDSVFVF